jgi:O-antigen ligase
MLIRQRPRDDFALVDRYALVEIWLTGLTLVLVLTAPKLKEILRYLMRTSGGLLILYYTLCAASALWSPMPQYSLFRALEYLSQVLAVTLALSYCLTFYNAERTVLIVSLMPIMAEILRLIILYGLAFSLDLWHTNSYSASAAMVSSYCLGEYFTTSGKRARMLIIFGMISFLFLMLGTSGASNVAAFCGFMTVAFLLRNRRLLFLGVLFGLIIWALGIGPDFIKALLFPAKEEELVMKLGGRTYLWEMYIPEIIRSPFYGHGFSISARLADLYTTSTHNAIFSVLLGTGIFGMALVVVGLIRWVREFTHAVGLRLQGSIGCTGALVAGLVNSMGVPIAGETWISPSLVFACFFSLHVLYFGQTRLIRRRANPIHLSVGQPLEQERQIDSVRLMTKGNA